MITKKEDLNILHLGRIIRNSRNTLIRIIFIVFATSLLFCFFSRKMYKAEATLLPLGGGQNSGMAMLASQLGSVPLIGGGIGGVNLQSPAGVVTALLTSKTVAERVVARFHLEPMIFNLEKWFYQKKEGPIQAAADYFTLNMLTIDNNMDTGTLTVSFESEDPQVSADVINGLLEELAKFINENSFSDAKKNRIFLEQQLTKNAEDLLQMGKEINDYYKRNNISSGMPNTDVKLDFAPVPSAAVNPNDTQKMNNTYLKLMEQKKQVEDKLQTVRVSDVPQQVYLEYLLLRREVVSRINGVLQQQYEMAKMNESKESVSFQVIDYARVPYHKSRPKTMLIVPLSIFLGFFIGLFYIFFREYIRTLKQAESE